MHSNDITYVRYTRSMPFICSSTCVGSTSRSKKKKKKKGGTCTYIHNMVTDNRQLNIKHKKKKYHTKRIVILLRDQ